jgi:aryl-alcohol dehydrogenase-like predicted oxidoreductase
VRGPPGLFTAWSSFSRSAGAMLATSPGAEVRQMTDDRTTRTSDRSERTSGTPRADAAGTITLGGDLTVNRLGFGAMRLTGAGIWGPPADRDEALAVLVRAVELGIDYIDTANTYGPHHSEELIADALFPYPDGLAIATKGGLERAGPGRWHPKGEPDYLRRELEGSLRRLRVDCVDLYQLHRIDPEIPESEQFMTLREFVDEGLVRRVGLSEVNVEQIERARGVVPIVSVQNRYNLEDRHWNWVLEHCEREGIAFLPWAPLSAGKIGSESALARVAARRDATPMQVAIAWLLARSPAMLPIPGTSRVAHLEENVAAASLELTREDLEELARSTSRSIPD